MESALDLAAVVLVAAQVSAELAWAVTGSVAFETTASVYRKLGKRAQILRRNPNLFDTRKSECVATS